MGTFGHQEQTVKTISSEASIFLISFIPYPSTDMQNIALEGDKLLQLHR